MNNLDKQYQNLLQDILDNGYTKGDRTGTGTISVFGREIRHKMSEGFPLLTTKKMHFKGIVTELLWFLKGDTNIKYLVDNDCNIWTGDAYKNYCKYTSTNSSEWDEWMRDNGDSTLSMYTKEEFINKIKTDDEFAKQWGDLGPIYGKQWRSWDKFLYEEHDRENNSTFRVEEVEQIDQIQNLINTLKTNPDDRRMIVTAWNPAEIDKAVLPPCHYGFQVYTRELSQIERFDWYYNKSEDKLGLNHDHVEQEMDEKNVPKRAISLKYQTRSQDVPLGTPYNIASYSILLEILAIIANMVPEELISDLGDTHIYLNQIDGVKEQLLREPYQLPKLHINTEFWPTESGECGVGPLTSNLDFLLENIQISDFQIENYQSHPAIKIPLSN